MSIRISHFGGSFICDNIYEAEDILKIRYGTGANEFWISADEEYPCLAVLINGESASLTYFKDSSDTGIQSVSDDDTGGSTVFYINSPTEKNYLSNSIVISTETALKAIRKFISDNSLPPSCVSWTEL